MKTISESQSIPIDASNGLPEAGFLSGLGMRIRTLRNLRGMTRKIVCRDAEVSERHLAQIEAGEGNVSIILLRRIAAALNVSLSELFSVQTEAHEENDGALRLWMRASERVPAHALKEAAENLIRNWGCDEGTRRERIALIGLRGAGKSTLGFRLAQEMNVPFVELDREIEKDAGMPLAEIFSLYGQPGYRRIEKRALERVLESNKSAVISVGGGVVSEKNTYDRLLASCFTIWVKARPEEYMSRVIEQGDFRAMAGNDEAKEDLTRILEAREPFYRKADAELDTSGESVEKSFAKLQQTLQFGTRRQPWIQP